MITRNSPANEGSGLGITKSDTINANDFMERGGVLKK